MDLNLTALPHALEKMGAYIYRHKKLLTILEIEEIFQNCYLQEQKLEGVMLCALKQGSISLEINSMPIKLQANNIIDLLPTDSVTNLTFSDNCQGVIMLPSKEFINSTLTNCIFPHDIISNRMQQLVIQLTPQEMNHLYANLHHIKRLTHNKNEPNPFQQEIIYSNLRIFFLEFIELLHQYRKTEKRQIPLIKSRRNLLFSHFVQLVISNCSAQRQVDWYASQLCIDPTYLSRLLIAHTGQNASYWLKYYLLQNAINYLEDRELTIQNISEKLGFSNVSSFCRFFKRNMQITPKAFRNQ